MFTSTPRNETHAVIDRAARRGDAALQAGADAAHHALDSIGESARRLQADAAALGQRSLDTLRDNGRQLRERAQVTGERTVDYIRDEPVKSVLLAAAAGAALVAVFGLLGSGRSRR
jgi:ElaB/YqjD/DUF883 family membrane-anchored ribosome-binding protein